VMGAGKPETVGPVNRLMVLFGERLFTVHRFCFARGGGGGPFYLN